MRFTIIRSSISHVLAILTISSAAGVAVSARASDETSPPERWGHTSVGKNYFPVPDGTHSIAIINDSFEQSSGNPAVGWAGGGFHPIAGDAPHGRQFLEAAPGGGCQLTLDGQAVLGGRAHLLSFWLRSTSPLRASLSALGGKLRFGQHQSRDLPSTEGQWKRVGLYFHVPPDATQLRFSVRVPKDPKLGAVAVDDVRLRTASVDEMNRAYDGWRAQWPERDLSPRPGDGANLALSVRKLTNGISPQRPFLVWAIGSSYTNMLGMGEVPIEIIRRRFPEAPHFVIRNMWGPR